ncbi:MAG: FMN-binding protein [Planctomycetota bacterium]|jgi:uncharacterized protein with FMN-binding domain
MFRLITLSTAFMLTVSLAFAGSLSLEDLEGSPKKPSWYKSKPASLNSKKPWQVVSGGRRSEKKVKETVCKLEYLCRKNKFNSTTPWLKMKLGQFLLDLNEDHLAWKVIEEVLALPSSTKYNSKIWGYPNLQAVKSSASLLKARLLARNGHKDEALKAFGNAKSSHGAYKQLREAEIYMLLGEVDKAGEILEKVKNGRSGHPEKNWGHVNNPIHTAAMARSLNMNDLTKEIAAPTVNRGRDAEKWPQWKSGWDILSTLADNAGKGKSADFTDLKDGTYSASCNGFKGEVKVSVKVKDGKVSYVKVVKTKEDRPYSAVKVVPKRIVERQSLQVDIVTGATVTSTAIITATDKALLKARK